MAEMAFLGGLRDGARKRLAIWAHLLRLLRSLKKASPALTIAVVSMRLLRALQPPAALFVGKLIIDEIILQSATPAPGPDFADWLDSGRLTVLAGWILLEFLLLVLANAMARIGGLVESLLADIHGNALAVDLIMHTARLDLKDIETSEAQDRLQRARIQTMMGGSLLSTILGQVQDMVTLALFLAGLVAYVPGLVALLLLALLPTLLSEAHFNRKHYELSRAATPERRWMEYVRHIGATFETAKEIRLFGLGDFLGQRFATLAATVFRATRALAIRRAGWSSLFGALASAAYYTAYAVIAWRAVKGEISIGELAFLTGSLLRLNGLFERLIVGLTQLTSNAQFLDDFFAFMALRPTMRSPAVPVPFPSPPKHGIAFENVGFRYPGKQDWALRHLSFTLPAGETLALVGENGAGKTTIVKLLTRLYDPDEGRILIDGIDLREMAPSDLHDHVGAIFQDFVRYQLTASENIGIGRVAAMADEARLREAARKSLAAPMIEKLPAGYAQMLGRSFALGVDLSGGEWQKLAIARAYFRDADILILDEPTAALDARAEAEVFERFRRLGHGKTALLISHRFSTVRTADRILVLDGGAIVESGDHAALVALGGRYAELFELQAAGFQ